MTVTMAQINALPDNPVKDWPTHLQDHAVIAQALKQYVPDIISLKSLAPSFATTANPTFTGTVSLQTLKVGTATNVGQVLTASNTTGTVQWADPAVKSVANKTGEVHLDVGDVNGAAPIDSPVFNGSVSTPTLIISGSDLSEPPKPGQVLTAMSDTGATVWTDRTLPFESLPNHGEEYRGMVIVVGEVGEQDTLYTCLRQASGQYRWHPITVGAPVAPPT